MRIQIRKTTDPRDYERVSPNMIYNRFDLFCRPGEFEAVTVTRGKESRVVEYRVTGDQAEIALWLTPITDEELDHLLYYITRNHPQVKKIIFKNALLSRGKVKVHNHFRIIFPDTVEEMEARVSPKSWHKMRRRNRRAEEAYGKMELIEYTEGNIPLDIVETFFRFKLATRNRVYNMTAQEYLDRYHVTECYVVKFGDTVGAMHFCCEQCPVVYGENHSYNPELKEYSLGKFIFAHSLVRMVAKKHTEIFLAGGDYEYKTHYGSIEETLYDCTVDVAELDFTQLLAQKKLSRRVKNWMKEHLPAETVEFLKKVRRKLKF